MNLKLKKIIKKFGFAFLGIWIAIKEEKFFVFHILAVFVVVGLGIFFTLSLLQWGLLIFAIGFVIAFEILNTGFEALLDMLSFKYDLKVKKIKDIFAGATLVSVFVAVTIGLIIFVPAFIKYF